MPFFCRVGPFMPGHGHYRPDTPAIPGTSTIRFRVAGQREPAPPSKFSNEGGFRNSVLRGITRNFDTNIHPPPNTIEIEAECTDLKLDGILCRLNGEAGAPLFVPHGLHGCCHRWKVVQSKPYPRGFTTRLARTPLPLQALAPWTDASGQSGNMPKAQR